MASRQEEKEARRRARLEQEERERKAAARMKRIQYVVGGVLVLGIIAGIVVALMASGGEDTSEGTTAGREASASADLPEPEILDEQEAAKAAGCEIRQVDNEGSGHEEREFTAADYEHNPPTSGTHFPSWAQDGIYSPGQTPPLGELVHTLEHGRINVQYAPGTPTRLIAQLEAFVAENDGYHMLLYENATEMEPQVAATAWDQALLCPKPSPQMWDALRTFRDAHIDRGPERVA
jgi:hypothetical protein